MKTIKKSLKNLAIILISFFLVCSSPIQTYAMKRSQQGAHLPTDQYPIEKYQKLPNPEESAALMAAEVNTMETSSSPVPIYPVSPVPPDPMNAFDVKILYNEFNECRTLRIDPKREFSPEQKLELDLLKEFLENFRHEIFDTLKVVGSSFPYIAPHTSIFKAFDIICVDNRIIINPSQVLNLQDWLILGHNLNATVYINKNHLAKCSRDNPEALSKIIFFALYKG